MAKAIFTSRDLNDNSIDYKKPSIQDICGGAAAVVDNMVTGFTCLDNEPRAKRVQARAARIARKNMHRKHR